MKNNVKTSLMSLAVISLLALSGCSSNSHAVDTHVTNTHAASDKVIVEQRAVLAASIIGHNVGAQAPRDIDSTLGSNTKAYTTAPASSAMNLCNIHFHKNAEHKGGEFTEYAGNGDGHGYQSGYKFTGTLTASESSPFEGEICTSAHSSLYSGDTIEVHYVYSSDDVKPGATLGACLAADRAKGTQPLLRVETQVYVVVNDEHALDFKDLTKVTEVHGFYQAANIPSNTGIAVQYEGSTTGPGYNEKVSPLQVTWSVRPKVAKVNIATVGDWCAADGYEFHEDHAHGVRNLVINPNLLSEIK